MKYLQRPTILHRVPRTALCGLVCLSLLAGLALAQSRRKQRTPRAIALVEWPAKGKPVVVPIAIRIDGRFYDASIYMADPVPMALESGTVYEVEQTGEPLGYATIDGAINSNGAWTAVAKYQTKAALSAARQKKSTPAVRPDPEEGPPRLTKGGEKSTPAQTPASQTPAAPAKQEPSAKSDEDRPRLHKPEEEAKPTTQPATEAQAAPEPEPDADMAGRPRLRRGKPVSASVESQPAPAVARSSTTSTLVRGRQTQTTAAVRVLPAVSDAGGPESRSFLMPGSETISPKLRSGMEDLARSALQKWADTHGGTHVGALEKVEIRSFDLSLTNQATVVLTASAHAAAPEPVRTTRRAARREPEPPPQTVDPDLTFWITVVARENYNGDLFPLEAWPTDSKHLDAYSRMELIDALDATGDGRGDLLFRAVSDLGRSFIVSRPSADRLITLYDSGEPQQ